MTSFGDKLRRERTQARVSLGQLARQLEVSVPYLSDVERNRRPPLSPERIRHAAAFMQIDPASLLRLAAQQRGHFELADPGTEAARQAGAALARRWPKMTEADFDALSEFIEKTFGREGDQ